MKSQFYFSQIKFLVISLLILACAGLGAAQPGNLDQTFQTRVEQSGAVRKTVVQPDGKTIIVGNFGKFNETSRNTIARVNADGSLDAGFDPGSGTNGAIGNIALQPDGKILICGNFTVVNGVSRTSVARLNQDGSVDTSFLFTPDPTGSNDVWGIALQPDSKILVHGTLVNYSINTFSIARLNSDGSLDGSFRSGVTALYLIITCAVQADGKIIIGGRWGNTGNLARLNADGSFDSTFTTGGVDDDVYNIAIQPDGKIIVIGRFRIFGVLTNNPIQRWLIARLNPADGSVDQSFNAGDIPPVSFEFNSGSIIIQPDGKLIFSGSGNKKIARLFSNGALDTSFAAGNFINGDVSSISPLPNGKFIAGGTFTRFARGNGSTDLNYRNGLTRLDANGNCDSSFNPGTGAVLTNYDQSVAVRAVEVAPDGKVYIAGRFNLVNGINRSYLARLNPDGSLDETFNAFIFSSNGELGDSSSTLIYLAQQPDGCVLTGVSLDISRLCGGAVDPNFSTNGSLLTYPLAVKVQPDGKILVAGSGLSGAADVVRLNQNGTVDASFTYVDTNSYVLSLALQGDGKVLIGGDFTSVNGSPRQRITRLNSNGTLDIDFLAGTSANGAVSSIVQQPDGKILFAGSFSQVRGISRHGIARIEANGEFDNSFFPGIGFAPEAVNSIVLQPDGKIIAGGNFTAFNNNQANGVARINPDGSFDQSFNVGSGVPAGMKVYTLALQNGRALVAGDFTSFNGQNKLRLVRLQKNAVRNRFDFDGDGRADVSVYRPAGGFWYLLNSTTGFSAAQFGVASDVIVPADYDADGKTDFAVFRPSNGTWYVQSSAFGFFAAQFGQNGDVPVAADYDNDGVADFAVFRPSNGTWYVQRSSAGFLAFQFGQNGDVPVIGDYDGDRWSDIAVFRPSNGYWYLQRSAEGFAAVHFGQNGDVPVPADYSGNGKTEPAVWRAAAASFYIARNLINPAQNFDAVQFGNSTDIPVPADYDGDARADIAVFRPSNGSWYRINSSNGQFSGVQFGVSTDKPIPAAFR